MIQSLTHTIIYVLDQDAAKDFYLTKLGFEPGDDIVMGDGFEGAGQGFRWLTVSPPGQPDVAFVLANPLMGHTPEQAEVLRELVAKGCSAERCSPRTTVAGPTVSCPSVGSSSCRSQPSDHTA